MNALTKLFRKPTAKEIAARDLEDARRHLLQQQAQAEYHAKLAEFYKGVIARLDKYLKED
jgi:transposase